MLEWAETVAGQIQAFLADRAGEIPTTFRAEAMSIVLLLGAIAAGLLAFRLLRWLVNAILGSNEAVRWRLVGRRVRGPVRLLLVLCALLIVAPYVADETETSALARRIGWAAAVGLGGWAILAALNAYLDLAERRYRLDVEDNLTARKHHTQFQVLRRAGQMLVVLVTAGGVLFTIPAVREYGLSLFASAGVAGIVIGIAARPVLANLIAGFQIAITQPIRIEDAVVVEGEWGWIEEITATYVVIRIWDWRRLIIPLSYFIEQPFQNWTRETATIMGSVFWHVDYTAPIQAIREKLEEVVERSPLWDRKVVVLQVVDADGDTLRLRALVSARNSPSAWDLRCFVREEIASWLQAEHPRALPRTRAELTRFSPGNPAEGMGMERADLGYPEPEARAAE
jgi:small-conductance mechanosensitive channel